VTRFADEAVADLHAARVALQAAFIALDRAAWAEERISVEDLRLIDAEFRGAAEEAALVQVVLEKACRGYR